MDFQFWLYLIIAVVYILSRAMKKKEGQEEAKPQPRREPNQRRIPDSPREAVRPVGDRPKQLTFEELLREIQESKKPAAPAPPSVPQYVDYDDDIKEEEQDLETIDYDYKKKDNIYQVYEDAKRQAFSRASLEETMNVRDTEMKFEKFKAFDQAKKKSFLDDYINDLKDPRGLRKAIVMGEILNRKF